MANSTPTIDELFRLAADGMLADFERVRKSMPHYGTSGQEAEDILIKFLNDHLPRRFAASSGFVIDAENTLSKQCDVLVYDAENSPIYRAGDRGLILPSDSIASVIEVKSKLTKSQLKDSVEKIASVKRLKRTPVSSGDQPVTFSELIVNSSYGVVFAYDADSSMNAIAENLKEFNQDVPRSRWIDAIIVLGKGTITYCVQFPGEANMRGQMMPAASEDFPTPACYVHMMVSEDGQYALNRFFGTLVATLAFYRKKTSIALDSIMKGSERTARTIQGYWYNSKRELVEVPAAHMGKGKGPQFEFDVFLAKSNNIVARFSNYEWSDGYVYRLVPPTENARRVLAEILKMTKQQNVILTPGNDGMTSFTSLLTGQSPSREEIKKHLDTQLGGSLEVRWYS